MELGLDILAVILCVLSAALAAGLTIGLISIDHQKLQLLLVNGSEEEKTDAKKILPLIRDRHWLLVTLFLFNASANEALPVFLDEMLPPVSAIIVATFSVLVFGEILPSAIFGGAKQVRIAATMSPLVWVLLAIFSPIAYPIARLLDATLGAHQHEALDARDLFSLMGMVSSRPVAQQPAPSILGNTEGSGIDLHNDAATIAQGAILSSARCVRDIVPRTPFETLFESDEVNEAWIAHVCGLGFSRLPVVNNMGLPIGYIVLKQVAPFVGKGCRVRDLPLHPLHCVPASMKVLELLNIMQTGASRIVAVVEESSERTGAREITPSTSSDILGFCTLTDVLEEVIQEELHDERDKKSADSILQALRQKRSKPETALIERDEESAL